MSCLPIAHEHPDRATTDGGASWKMMTDRVAQQHTATISKYVSRNKAQTSTETEYIHTATLLRRG